MDRNSLEDDMQAAVIDCIPGPNCVVGKALGDAWCLECNLENVTID